MSDPRAGHAAGADLPGDGGDGLPGLSDLLGTLDLADLQGVLDAAREADEAAGDPLGEDAVEAALSGTGRRWSPAEVAGAAAEDMTPGPGLGYWISCVVPGQMSDYALPGVAAACRRLASWAQATELAMVAEVAARAAARDEKVPAGPDGRPGQVSAEAAAEVALALRMSQYGAACWTDLAITLAWRLPGTASALRDGVIDLTRARIIAETTSVLDDRGARLAEDKVLPGAESKTPGQLRAALRRAVITVDPDAAERRREEAERKAKISLYGDEEGTATLSGQNLPGAHAAAAMARISALARAMQASGAGGGIDLLRAQVYIGLLLGTLPLIPPAEDAPPDPDDGPGSAPHDGPAGPAGDPGAGAPRSPGGGTPGDPGPAGPGGGDPDGLPDPWKPGDPDDQGDLAEPGDPDDLGDPGEPGDPDNPGDPGEPGDLSDPGEPGDLGDSGDPYEPGGRGEPVDPGDPGDPGDPDHLSDPGDLSDPGEPGGPDGVGYPGEPGGPGDSSGPGDPGTPDDLAGRCGNPGGRRGARVPPWPGLPAPGQVPAGLTRSGTGALAGLPRGPAGPGMLRLTVPWRTLAGMVAEPGQLTRIGPITPDAARCLAAAAAPDPTAEWTVIVTDERGRAIAVTRLRRSRARPPGAGQHGPPQQGPGKQEQPEQEQPEQEMREQGRGLIGRVTVTVPAGLARDSGGRRQSPGAADAAPAAATLAAATRVPGRLGEILAAALAAAASAAARADSEAAQAGASGAGPGGCAHRHESPGYRPPPRLRELVAARDQTCRFGPCRQPAHRADQDHTIPYDQGGRTCSCNLGGACRTHHKIKQRPGWQLSQPEPGTFTWVTPAGRTYTVTPDIYPA